MGFLFSHKTKEQQQEDYIKEAFELEEPAQRTNFFEFGAADTKTLKKQNDIGDTQRFLKEYIDQNMQLILANVGAYEIRNPQEDGSIGFGFEKANTQKAFLRIPVVNTKNEIDNLDFSYEEVCSYLEYLRVEFVKEHSSKIPELKIVNKSYHFATIEDISIEVECTTKKELRKFNPVKILQERLVDLSSAETNSLMAVESTIEEWKNYCDQTERVLTREVELGTLPLYLTKERFTEIEDEICTSSLLEKPRMDISFTVTGKPAGIEGDIKTRKFDYLEAIELQTKGLLKKARKVPIPYDQVKKDISTLSIVFGMDSELSIYMASCESAVEKAKSRYVQMEFMRILEQLPLGILHEYDKRIRVTSFRAPWLVNMSSIYYLSYGQLLNIPGIGKVTAGRILAVNQILWEKYSPTIRYHHACSCITEDQKTLVKETYILMKSESIVHHTRELLRDKYDDLGALLKNVLKARNSFVWNLQTDKRKMKVGVDVMKAHQLAADPNTSMVLRQIDEINNLAHTDINKIAIDCFERRELYLARWQ